MNDPAIRKLRQIGLKVTSQRQPIVRLLDGNRTHPSEESIYHEVLKQYPRISFATVYTTLSTLAKAGQIQELDIDPTRIRFDPTLAPLHHFYGKVCENVFDVAYETPLPANTTSLNTRNVNGHQVDAVQVHFRGVCQECGTKRETNPARLPFGTKRIRMKAGRRHPERMHEFTP